MTTADTSSISTIPQAGVATPTPEGFATPAAAFIPALPQTLAESGLTEPDVEALILKSMYYAGAATGRAMSVQLKLPGPFIREAIDRLRADLLIANRGTADLVDYVFQLTEVGAQRAKQYALTNTYCGAAPVPLASYIRAVQAQSIRRQPISLKFFRDAMSNIYLGKETINILAQAVNAGRGLFLFGSAGNGKTTVAQRLARSFGDYVWIPRAVSVGGEIIRLFDSSVHVEVRPQQLDPSLTLEDVDQRWALIERPTIVVGGELTMDLLEIGQKAGTTVLEAPVQMKANGGVLVIDDFGRQRVRPEEIFNRWIVPLDRGRDYLSLPNGRQITVPFDQVLVMATNLEPRELVDEAFLRRIPFKVKMPSPDRSAFSDVFLALAKRMKIEATPEDVQRLLDRYYTRLKIEPRFCQPRDLLFHVANICDLHKMPRRVTDETIDMAVRNYFVGMFGVGEDHFEDGST